MAGPGYAVDTAGRKQLDESSASNGHAEPAVLDVMDLQWIALAFHGTTIS